MATENDTGRRVEELELEVQALRRRVEELEAYCFSQQMKESRVSGRALSPYALGRYDR